MNSQNKLELNDIALIHGTDKSSVSHNFTKYYQEVFDKFREKKLKLLEIGVLKGHSLKMWYDYFPNADIYGVDIIDTSFVNNDRIHTFIGSQTDSTFLKQLNLTHGPFDIIIDDGSHKSKDMRVSFEILFPMLKSGGYYVIEDLCCCYWSEFIDEKPTFIDHLKNMVDDVNCRGKSIHANRCLDDADMVRGLSFLEQSIDAIYFYRSLCFVRKI